MIIDMAAPAPVAVAAIHALFAVDGGVPDITPNMRVAQPPSLLAPRPILRKESGKDPYQLRQAKDGTGDLLYEEAAFVARVARDGAVRFVTKHDIKIHLLPPFPKRGVHVGVPSLWSSLKAVARGDQPPPPPAPDESGPPPETTTPIPAVTRYRPDPREGCRMCGPLPPVYPSIVLEVDLTDEIIRMSGQDPYRYQKAKFLVSTRERRVRMAVVARGKDLRRAAAELPSLLVDVACDERRSVRERRAILETLHADMDTKTADGREAAARIEQFLVSGFGAATTCAHR